MKMLICWFSNLKVIIYPNILSFCKRKDGNFGVQYPIYGVCGVQFPIFSAGLSILISKRGHPSPSNTGAHLPFLEIVC